MHLIRQVNAKETLPLLRLPFGDITSKAADATQKGDPWVEMSSSSVGSRAPTVGTFGIHFFRAHVVFSSLFH